MDSSADPYAYFLSSVAQRRTMEHGSGKYIHDSGHPWFMEKHKVLKTASFKYSYYGERNATGIWFMPNPSSVPSHPSFNAVDCPSPDWADDLAAFGQQAFSRSAPVPSVFNGAQFLGELREGLPKLVGVSLLKGRAKELLKNAGSEYLNYQFGVLPLISDIRAICTALLNLEETLVRKRTSQGKPKKARFALPYRNEFREYRAPMGEVLWTSGWRVPARPYGPVTSREALRSQVKGVSTPVGSFTGTDLYFLQTLRTRRWFEGSFTSFFDYPPSDASWIDKARSIVSTDFDLQTLWELAPWSWLVDWVFKIQSTLSSNAIASDERVVLNYGYVMEKSSFRSMFSGSLSSIYPGTLLSSPRFDIVTEDTYFRRIRANPFGFQASSPGQLNANQLAILAALGLSKG